MVSLATAEGIVEPILRVPGRCPALHDRDQCRRASATFNYWHEGAPARELFEFSDVSRIAEGSLSRALVYFSGITLSIYCNAALAGFWPCWNCAARAARRSRSTAISSARWKGDIARTRTVFIEALKRVDIALPTLTMKPSCGAILAGGDSRAVAIFRDNEIAVKNGPNRRWSRSRDQYVFQCRRL